MSCATLGRSVLGLLGDPEFVDFDSLLPLSPPDSYDSLLRKVSYSNLVNNALKTPWTLRALPEHFPSENRHASATAKRRYKPVDRKVRPVPTYMPNPIAQQYKRIPDPQIEPLPTRPPPRSTFVPTERMTRERYDQLLSTVPDGFLSEQELDLLAFIVARRQDAFAWTFQEKGTFKREYYPDYEIAVIEHTPWVQPPIRVPLALQPAVRKEITEQEAAGRFEPTVASYRSSLFAVAKKNGSIRLVIDLQKLNAVTIRDSSLPPNVEDFAEQFVGRAIYGAADLYSGFDARILHPNSRPLTAFHSICGPKQQCTLPQGATNSPQEFQRCTRHALQAEIPENTDVFIDDCGMMGPKTDYGGQPIEGNPHIRRYVFEYAITLDRILARFIMAGMTASGTKTVLAAPQLKIVGTIVSLQGWHLDHGLITKIQNWPPCRNVSDVRGFLGTVGCGRKWIKNFSIIAKPLTSLLRGNESEFLWTDEAQQAMDHLKEKATTAPVLVKIDYEKAKRITQLPRKTDDGLVVVAVDSAALHGAGWVVYQIQGNEKRPAIYGSCTFNETESRYSQPKAELYGVFRAFRHLRHRIWGVRFRLEHDAKFLQQLIYSPDLPNAPMTRWISFLMLFDFEMKHVSAENHKAADGLSRRPKSSLDSDEEDCEQVLDALPLSASRDNDRVPDCHRDECLASPDKLLKTLFRPGSTLSSSSVKHLLSFIFHFRSSSLPSSPLMFRFSLPLTANPEEPPPPYQPYGRPHPDRFTINNISLFIREPAEDEDLYLHSPYDSYRAGGEYDPAHETDLFKHSALRFTTATVYVGHDFEVRHYHVPKTDEFLLGDEVITLEYEYYVGYSYEMSPLREGALPPPVFVADSVEIGPFTVPWTAHHREDNRLCMTVKPAPTPTLDEAKATKRTEQDGEWLKLRMFYASQVLPAECFTDPNAMKRFRTKAAKFFLENGSLFKKPSPHEPIPRLVVESEQRRQQLLVQAHDQCGHRGRDATYKLLSLRYYWPLMYDDVSFYVRSCLQCQLNSQSKPIVPYSPSWSASILRHFHLDTQYMEVGLHGKRFVISAVDSFSGWIEARALKKADSEAVARFIYEDVICRFSCIPYFTVDGGSEFKGFVDVLFRQYQVTVVVSNAYHPESNGIVERSHQVLLNSVKKLAHPHPARWPLYLPSVLLSMRVTTSRSTGLSPFFLVYGVQPVFSFDLQDATWGVLDWHKVRSTTDLIILRSLQIAQRDQIAQEAHRHQTINRQKSIDNFNDKMKTASFTDFEVGMWVLRHETWIDGQHGSKNQPKWSGPYIIHEVRPNKSFVLRELDGTVIRGHVTAHRLRLFFFRDQQTLLRTIANAKSCYRYLNAGSDVKPDHPDPVARRLADRALPCREVDYNGDHRCDLHAFSCRRPNPGRWRFEYLHGHIKIPSFDSNLFTVNEDFFGYAPWDWWSGSIGSIPGVRSSIFADEHERMEQDAIEDTLAVNPTFFPPFASRLRYPYGFLLPPSTST